MFVLLLSVCVSAYLGVLYCIEFVVFIYTHRERERERAQGEEEEVCVSCSIMYAGPVMSSSVFRHHARLIEFPNRRASSSAVFFPPLLLYALTDRHSAESA